MAIKKSVTSDVTETPEVVIVETAVEVIEEAKPSAQTLAEMEAGRAALVARAESARAELGEV